MKKEKKYYNGEDMDISLIVKVTNKTEEEILEIKNSL